MFSSPDPKAVENGKWINNSQSSSFSRPSFSFGRVACVIVNCWESRSAASTGERHKMVHWFRSAYGPRLRTIKLMRKTSLLGRSCLASKDMLKCKDYTVMYCMCVFNMYSARYALNSYRYFLHMEHWKLHTAAAAN